MPTPVESPTQTPVVTPSTTPTPWQEQFTSPDEICDQQVRELGSPDVAP